MDPHKRFSHNHSILAIGLGVLLLCLLLACQQSEDKRTPRPADSERRQETAGDHTRTGTEEVHALLIILGNDRNIRDTVNATKGQMLEVLKQVSFHSTVNLTLMKSASETIGRTTTQTLRDGQALRLQVGEPGDLIRSSQVVAWLDNLKLDKEDTVLIYYNGHGKMDALGTHSLEFDRLNQETLDREKLATRLRDKPARLRMLITDTCSQAVDAEDATYRALAQVRERKHVYLEDLFLGHAGFLDITAASPNQVAIGHKDIGGHFTYALFTEGCSPDADRNKDNFITWKEAFATASAETDRLFREASPELNVTLGSRLNGQKTQKPIAHSLPMRMGGGGNTVTTMATATLNFTSVPPNAEVFIDDAFAGNTPLRAFEIETDGRSTKKIKVSVKAKGHQDMEKELWVQRGKSVNHEFTLTKDIPQTFTGRDGAEMVLIPAGEFQIGSNAAKMVLIPADEFQRGGRSNAVESESNKQPVRTVYVDAFYMDETEVTNAQFKEFLIENPRWQKDRVDSRFPDAGYLHAWEGNSYPSGKGNHPVVCVSWYAAMAYAEWAGNGCRQKRSGNTRHAVGYRGRPTRMETQSHRGMRTMAKM